MFKPKKDGIVKFWKIINVKKVTFMDKQILIYMSLIYVMPDLNFKASIWLAECCLHHGTATDLCWIKLFVQTLHIGFYNICRISFMKRLEILVCMHKICETNDHLMKICKWTASKNYFVLGKDTAIANFNHRSIGGRSRSLQLSSRQSA